MRGITGDADSGFRVDLPQHALVQLLAFSPAILLVLINNFVDFDDSNLSIATEIVSGLSGFGNALVYFVQKKSAEKREHNNELEIYHPQGDGEHIAKDSLEIEAYMVMHSDL